MIRTASGPPTSTTASFPARWFLSLSDQGESVGSATLAPRDANLGIPTIRLCGPCLPHDSGRIVLTLAQVTALVNQRLRIEVWADSGARVASGDIDRRETPVFWPGKRGLIGGRLEIRRPSRSG